MSAKPRTAAAWVSAQSVAPEARAFLKLVDPPEQPLELRAFLAGVTEALLALSPGHELKFHGKPIGAIVEHLQSALPGDARAIKSQWDQDPLRGTGATAYRAFAQPAPSIGAGGYACLKAILLGLLLVRHRDRRAASLEAVDALIRFIRLGSPDVRAADELARGRVIASLPATFIPSAVRAVLARREGVPESLHPRLEEVGQAVDRLCRSFALLDRTETVPAPSSSSVPLGAGSQPAAPGRERPSPLRRAAARRRPFEPARAEADGSSATYTYGPAVTPPPELVRAIREAAEAVDDRVALTEGLARDAPSSEKPVERHMTAQRLLSDARQGFWARVQWDALTPGEMRHAIDLIRRELEKLTAAPNPTRHEALALALVSASTGLPKPRCHSIRLADAKLAEADESEACDYLEPETGTLTIPVVGAEERFSPQPEQMQWLREVSDMLPILLAAEVVAELSKLVPTHDGYVFRTELTVLEDILDEIFRDARQDEPRITAARLARGHQLELLSQCGHPASAQMLSGQTLGSQPVGIAYCTASASSLQNIYNRAIVRHGLSPNPVTESSACLVGSKLSLTETAWADVIRSINKGMVNRPREQRTQGRELLYLHGSLVRACSAMWMAATGFRPTFRLGEVRASHINWLSSTAVIVDKVTDSAHEGRLVPIAPTLMQSLCSYSAVLDMISSSKEIKSVVRTAARRALTSGGALFFTVDESGMPRPLEPDDLKSRLPEWWNLPLNCLRHRLASRLPELGCPGPYVQALMGHLDQGIQPFGSESFMLPEEYLKTTRDAVEQMLRADGWRPLMGGMGSTPMFITSVSPVGTEVVTIESEVDEATIRSFRRHVEAVRSLQADDSDNVSAAVAATVRSITPWLVDDPAQNHEIEAGQVSALREAVCADANSAAAAEVRVRALRMFLKRGREQHGWKVRRLPHFFRVRPKASTHHPEFVPAHMALERLRAHFWDHLSVRGEVKPDPSAAALNLVLALILWQGVCSWQRMQRILAGLKDSEALSPGGEAIAIPTWIPRFENDSDPVESSEVLMGAVALAALTARQHMVEFNRAGIEALVSGWVPDAVVRAPVGKVLDVLFAIARIGHRFESPPPMRLVWSEEVLSVPMPLDRLRALFGVCATRPNADDAVDADGLEVPDYEGSGASESPSEFQWLKAVLRAAKDTSSSFPDDDSPSGLTSSGVPPQTLPSPKKATSRSLASSRMEAIRRLRSRLSSWKQDGSLVRALTAYALDRLENGTPFPPRVESSTVYKYAVSAGRLITAMAGKTLAELEAEDFIEIYTALIDLAPELYRDEFAAHLSYFHDFLAEQKLAPGVSMGRPNDDFVCLPEVGYVAPAEVLSVIERIRTALSTNEGRHVSVLEPRAALAAAYLGFAAGARTSETLLREDRELVVDRGRRALIIRRNRWVPTKTRAGYRVVDLELTMPEAGWAELNYWRTTSSLLRTARESRKAALFSDEIDGGRPMRPIRITRRITAALRSATGRRDARIYWWRHTAVCNEMLSVFATTEMLDAIRRASLEASGQWFPDGTSVMRAIGGDLPLGPSHAAGFRARRGHAGMHTSVSTYMHVSGLVEPWACRTASEELPTTAIAALSGVRIAAVRQRLSRASIATSSSRAAIRLMIQQGCVRSRGVGDDGGIPEVAAEEGAGCVVRDVEAYLESLLRSLRSRDLTLMARSLHLSAGAAARMMQRLTDGVNTNPFGLHVGWGLQAGADSGGLPQARVKPTAPLSFARVDKAWIRRCMSAQQRSPDLSKVWAAVLQGLEPRSGVVLVRSKTDFEMLLRWLPLAIGQELRAPYRVTLVVDKRAGVDVENLRQLADGTDCRSAPVREAFLRPPAGWLLAGVAVESVTTGRRQVAGLAMLGVASTLVSLVQARGL